MCNSFIIMRMVNPSDERFVRNVIIETLGEDDARMLPDLDKGEAIFELVDPLASPVLPRLSRRNCAVSTKKKTPSKNWRERSHSTMIGDSANRQRRL